MARLTIRLSEVEERQLRGAAEAAGESLSAYVRQELALTAQVRDDRLESVEKRIARLEELAGL